MGLFSLNWFKSNKELNLKQEVEKIEKKVDVLLDAIHTETIAPRKVYKKIKLVNDVLTIVFEDGSLVTKQGATMDDFTSARNATSEKELFGIVSAPIIDSNRKEIEEKRGIDAGVLKLVESGEFESKDDSIYLKGINRSVPELLLKEFGRLAEQEESYDHLKKFWLKCCLNPNAQSAEDLYTFLSHHQFKIDKHGNFYAYRRVVSKNNEVDKKFVEFVSNTYNKIKAVWKKNPANFIIDKYKDTGEYEFYNYAGEGYYKGLGILKDLYLNLPNMKGNSYTDAHTGKFDYRVGEIASMPRHYGDDDNTINCSKGFHAASKAYDYSGFGDTPILMIINPMDVLAVPQGEVGKLRTCRWFFAMTLPEDEKYILDDDAFDVSDLGDIFEEKSLKDLTFHVQTSFAEEVQRHTFQLPKLSATELGSIVDVLEEMHKAIANRVSVIQ